MDTMNLGDIPVASRQEVIEEVQASDHNSRSAAAESRKTLLPAQVSSYFDLQYKYQFVL